MLEQALAILQLGLTSLDYVAIVTGMIAGPAAFLGAGLWAAGSFDSWRREA